MRSISLVILFRQLTEALDVFLSVELWRVERATEKLARREEVFTAVSTKLAVITF